MVFSFLAGCSETYKTSPGSIAASSEGDNVTGLSCTYYFEGDVGHYAVLNFTSFHGFPLPQLPPGEEEKETSDKCLPLVQIMEIVGQGSERFLGNVCYATPKVFHSNSHIVKMAFRWSPSQNSGFTLAYSFQKQGSKNRLYSNLNLRSSRPCLFQNSLSVYP